MDNELLEEGFTLTHIGREPLVEEEISEIQSDIAEIAVADAPEALRKQNTVEADVPPVDDIPDIGSESEFVLDEIDKDVAELGMFMLMLQETKTSFLLGRMIFPSHTTSTIRHHEFGYMAMMNTGVSFS